MNYDVFRLYFQANHYGFVDNDYNCYPCGCNPYGTISGSLECNIDGYCACTPGKNRINNRKCDGCPHGQTLDASGIECEGLYLFLFCDVEIYYLLNSVYIPLFVSRPRIFLFYLTIFNDGIWEVDNILYINTHEIISYVNCINTRVANFDNTRCH